MSINLLRKDKTSYAIFRTGSRVLSNETVEISFNNWNTNVSIFVHGVSTIFDNQSGMSASDNRSSVGYASISLKGANKVRLSIKMSSKIGESFYEFSSYVYVFKSSTYIPMFFLTICAMHQEYGLTRTDTVCEDDRRVLVWRGGWFSRGARKSVLSHQLVRAETGRLRPPRATVAHLQWHRIFSTTRDASA